MKRKMRRFEEGGMADDTEDMPGMSRYSGGRSGMSMSPRRGQSEDEPKTFAQAFAKARANKQATFTFTNPKTGKTDTYHTRTKEEEGKEDANKKSSGSTPSRVTKTETTTEVETPASIRRSGGRGSKPGSARVGTGRYDDPTSTYAERVFSPLRKLGDVFGLRREEQVMRNMGVDREEARRRLRAKEESGMYRGGSIKKMAGGGMARSSASRRADGIAKKGKTRGRIV